MTALACHEDVCHNLLSQGGKGNLFMKAGQSISTLGLALSLSSWSVLSWGCEYLRYLNLERFPECEKFHRTPLTLRNNLTKRRNAAMLPRMLRCQVLQPHQDDCKLQGLRIDCIHWRIGACDWQALRFMISLCHNQVTLVPYIYLSPRCPRSRSGSHTGLRQLARGVDTKRLFSAFSCLTLTNKV